MKRLFKIQLTSDFEIDDHAAPSSHEDIKGYITTDIDMGSNGGMSNIKICSIEEVETHADLPLVRFDYPSSMGSNYHRYVRATQMNDTFVEGFEVMSMNSSCGAFKRFLLKKMNNPVELLQLPIKA